MSIIIPAWNEAKTLRATVEALLEIDYDKKKCEVIVVGGGGDGTYEIAQELSAGMEIFSRYAVILQGPDGKNAAIQEGVKRAKNEIIVLLDADTMVSLEWLREMVQPIEEGGCDLTIANPEPVRKNWVSGFYMISKAYLLDRITTYSGHAMAFRASIVRNRLDHFFDRRVKVGVDYALAKKFLEEGRKVVLAKDARVITHMPSSLKYFVICELRWLTALINLEGVKSGAIARNVAVVGALIFAIPLFEKLFAVALLFNVVYILKRVRMFFLGSRSCVTGVKSVFGFVLLSYTYHVVGLISYVRYFLGLSRETYLYQGQRDYKPSQKFR